MRAQELPLQSLGVSGLEFSRRFSNSNCIVAGVSFDRLCLGLGTKFGHSDATHKTLAHIGA